MNILVLGPQGSGKGTQAKRINATYGIPHIATGDMLREMRGIDNDLGRELSEVMDRGDLVNDELMIRLIHSRLSRGDTLGASRRLALTPLRTSVRTLRVYPTSAGTCAAAVPPPARRPERADG